MKKLFVAIICLFSVWAVMTACDDTSDPDTYTLSGDITAEFDTGTPSDTVTINLMAENDCEATPLFSYSTDEWRTDKFSAFNATRYASYEISGIEAGTYSLCGSSDLVNMQNYTPYGPVEIEISGDAVQDIEF